MKVRNIVLASLLTSLYLLPSFASSLDSLVKDLSKGASSLKEKKVAVLPFLYPDGRMSSGSSLISDRLAMEIGGKRGIQVVDRRLMEQRLNEKQIDSGAAIPAELKAIGSLLDVDAIIIGTLIDLPSGKTEIHAHLVKANSGEVLAAGEEAIMRTWKDKPVLPAPVVPSHH